jgi:hypothetical protein
MRWWLSALLTLAGITALGPAMASDSSAAIKVEIRGRMLYVPVAWAERIVTLNGDPHYDQRKPRTDIVYKGSSLGFFNRNSLPKTEQDRYWNEGLWPDFKVGQIEFTNGRTPLHSGKLSDLFPNGWWPVKPESARDPFGSMDCERIDSMLSSQFGIRPQRLCNIRRDVGHSLSVRYSWNRAEIGEMHEREQDLRVQHLLEWLVTPPDRRTARPID